MPLTGPRTIVDFIPEKYFKLPGELKVRGKGVSEDRSLSWFLNKDQKGNGAAFVPIALRIRTTEEEIVKETNQLLQLKLVARINHIENTVQYDYAHSHI